MSYYFETTTDYGFDKTIEKLTDDLMENKFGIITDTDFQAKIKEKMDIDIPKYRILGACNPPSAYKMYEQEKNIGAMLPCNIVVRDAGNGKTIVAAVDPVISLQGIDSDTVKVTTAEVREIMKKVIENL